MLARRSLATVAATAGLLAASLPVSPAASAATSGSCPEAASTRLVTARALGDQANYTQFWLYAPINSDWAYVCFVLPQGLGSGAIVVDDGAGITPGDVYAHSNPNACAFEVVDVQDPAPVRITYGRVVPMSVCITVAGETTAVTVEPAVYTRLPGVEIWRDGTGSVLDVAACADWLAAALAELPGAASEYQDCTFRNARIL